MLLPYDVDASNGPSADATTSLNAVAMLVPDLGLTALGTVQANASTTAIPTISTYSAWDHSSLVSPFGCPDTTAYGETITVPPERTIFYNVKFPWVSSSPTDS